MFPTDDASAARGHRSRAGFTASPDVLADPFPTGTNGYRRGDPPEILLRAPGESGATPSARRRSGQTRRSPAPGEPLHITVNTLRVRQLIWAVIAFLVLMNLISSAGAGLRFLPYTLTRFFDGDDKVNFPTTGKTLLLLTSTVLLLTCWAAARRRRDPSAAGWLLLGLCTAFAFGDESIYLHQTLAEVLNKKFHFTGPLTFAWTIVYWPMAAMASIVLVRYLRTMHPRVRRLLLPGGVLYVTGAILIEPVKSELADRFGEGTIQMEMAAALSDSMQLIGLALLVGSLLTALSLLTPEIRLSLRTRRG
ncbi:MAG: hypothetical protein IPJ14_06985 [Kineosporiaceae bacterium]|nr:hypothetical protein [Kineosporiaceae bacterium]MBK7622401.1 hypothetical protein [Kineosporiaceae bacterium]MBK8075467.1 hypothetical protein [Kineosporiaceae bacterium]